MYTKTISAATPTAGVLAYTGSMTIWYLVAAVALISLGFTLMRLVPRSQA